MPDRTMADGEVLTSAFWDTFVREQVVSTVTSTSRPRGVEGRVIYETDTDLLLLHNGTDWTHLADDEWTSFTPTWTGVTTTGATQACYYRQSGKQIDVIVRFQFGAGTAFTSSVRMDLPVTARTFADGYVNGIASYLNAGVTVYPGMVAGFNADEVYFYAHRCDGSTIQVGYNSTNVNGSVPFTWGSGDVLYAAFSYEAA